VSGTLGWASPLTEIPAELDRGNISNAITDNMMRDVGITQNQFNVGQQMLSLGIVLFEIPSNMILYRVGPGRWLTLQLFLFGTVSTFQAFQSDYGSFIATRFLLGITESGFIPGGLWTLSTWYTRRETAKRVMFFYFGNQFGQASSKLLAYGILHMRGVGGKPGWFWLFVIMGLFTIFSGCILGLCLPDSFKNPRSTFLPTVSWFSDRELHILKTRVLLDDPMKGKKKSHIPLGAFKRAVSCLVPCAMVDELMARSSPIGDWSSTSSSRCAITALNVVSTRTRLPW
jgi:MFS family permease